jgi:class 3 adenylate cyclase
VTTSVQGSLPRDAEALARRRRTQSLSLAYGGWIVAILVIKILQLLNYSEITNGQILVLFSLATIAHVIGYCLVRFGIDRRIAFDPHFVYVPNWLLFGPVSAYGFYAVGGARDIMLGGYLMGFIFLAGYARLWTIISSAAWYMLLYLGLLLVVRTWYGISFDMLREVIRTAVFLMVCTFIGMVLDRFAAQKAYLKASLTALREKDQEITLLNQKLAKFVTVQLVEQFSRDHSDAFLAQQRRRITIYFSDIQDFSVITDALEPEELSGLINEYFTVMSNIALQCGGTVDKLMGDAMMVFFGAPMPQEPAEGALRCVQMALAMRKQLAELNAQWQSRGHPFAFRVRSGINTGVSTVGSFGSDTCLNYTAIGSQVHIAARLQQMAQPGQILLSHACYVLVADAVQVEALGEVRLKGIQYPVQVYELKGVVPDKAEVLRA